MCLAIPMELKERSDLDGVVEIDGVRRNVSLALVPEASLGDYVLVHAGFAIACVDRAEALETIDLFHQLAQAEQDE